MTGKSGGSVHPKGKSFVSIAFGYVLPVVLTVLLVWYMFRKVDFRETIELASHGVDYWWIVLAMVMSVFSHIFRAARWKLQLNALGIKPPFIALCCSVFGCYALNLVFPRLGEIWRCTYISHRQKAPFPSVLGSLIGDRLSDTLTVLFLLLLCFAVAFPALESFLIKYPIGQDIVGLLYSGWFWASVVGAVAVFFAAYRIFRTSAPVKRLKKLVSDVWAGFIVVATMKGRGRFLFLTLCIWGCYYFQLYVAFFAFDFTRELCQSQAYAFGLVPCLVAFVLSSISMAIPSNGGLGPWNLAIMFGLAVYGVTDAQGTAFSMLLWTGETIMLVLLGVFTMGYIASWKS